MTPFLILKTANKTMINTMGPVGLAPSLSVFVVLPLYSPAVMEGTRKNQRRKMKAIYATREEYFLT